VFGRLSNKKLCPALNGFGKHHYTIIIQCCADVAPPGMALDESDEESESDSSTMSETSMNDEASEFFPCRLF